MMSGKPFQILLTILISTSNVQSIGSPWDWQMSRHPPPSKQDQSSILRPIKTKANAANVTVNEGQTAILPCEVDFLGEYTVSWLRGKDTSVLSVGLNAFSSDERISVRTRNKQLSSGNDEHTTWILQIRGVFETDQGWYECQVNTEPKISHKSFLRVVSARDKISIQSPQDAPQLPQVIPQIQEFLTNALPPKISVSGPAHRWKNLNDALSLECTLNKASSRFRTKSRLYWTFNQLPVEADENVQLHNGDSDKLTYARLSIRRFTQQNEGTFHCRSDDPSLEAVTVQVNLHQQNDDERPMVLPQVGVPDKVDKNPADLELRLNALEERVSKLEAVLGQFGLSSHSSRMSTQNNLLLWLPFCLFILYNGGHRNY